MILFLTQIDDPDDREFFNQLYDKYHKMLFDCAMKNLKNHHDAEDAVQQVLLNLWKYIDNLKKVSDKKLAGYLYATVRNHCCDLAGKNKHIILNLDEIPETDLPTEASTELTFIKKYEYSLLMKAFDELSPNYRQIILDKAILHLNDKQAAEHTKIKVTYVRECLSRARATLHKLYIKKLKKF